MRSQVKYCELFVEATGRSKDDKISGVERDDALLLDELAMPLSLRHPIGYDRLSTSKRQTLGLRYVALRICRRSFKAYGHKVSRVVRGRLVFLDRDRCTSPWICMDTCT